jgi:asparagine synthase (glutamine-hydrolysing)
MEPGQAALRRYWDPTSVSSTSSSKEDAIGGLRAALERSVRRRIADAPAAGVLLSGGLDSSAIAAMLSVTRQDGQGQLLEAYSATFPDHPGADESDLIDRTTRHLGLRSTRIVVREGGVVDGMLGYLASWGVPPTSPNLFFWVPLLERAASDGMKVMLDGEGGDEVFGLSPYLLADRIRHGRLLAAIELARRFPGSADPAAPARVWRLLRRWGLKGALPAGSHQMARRLRGAGHYTPGWLRPAMARLWLETEAGYAWKASPGPRWRAFLGDAMTGLGPRWVYEQARRRTAMWGIEARHPLVDVDVVELIMQLPPELAFDPQASRPLLRGCVDRLLPDEVRLRPAKASFDAVFFSGLTGPDLAAVRGVLERGDAEIGAYVDLSAMRRLLLDSDPPTDRWKLQPWATTVWRLLTAECWLRSQSDLDFPARLAESGLLSPARHELSGSDDLEVVDKPPKTL